jgi:hypothetical protein
MSIDARPGVVRGVSIGIEADPHRLLGTFRTIEKDMIAYRSGTWVRMYDM